MLVNLLKSKIHRAIITDACLNYEGSLTLDTNLMCSANLYVNEKVQVVNIQNGIRFETYVIEGEENSGQVVLNGAAARLGLPGDLIIIMSFALYSKEEVSSHVPNVVLLDQSTKKNQIK